MLANTSDENINYGGDCQTFSFGLLIYYYMAGRVCYKGALFAFFWGNFDGDFCSEEIEKYHPIFYIEKHCDYRKVGNCYVVTFKFA